MTTPPHTANGSGPTPGTGAVPAIGGLRTIREKSIAGLLEFYDRALGADENSTSAYARSKAAGEKAALAAVPGATIFRPAAARGGRSTRITRQPGCRSLP